MAVEADESNANGVFTMIDETYEFSAPKFFDFINGETEEDKRKAELWFDSALSYAPSPCMARIKTGRSIKVEALCDFGEAETQASESSDSTSATTESKAPSESSDPTSKDEGAALVELGKANLLSTKVSSGEESSNKDKDASVASHNTGSASSTKQLEPQPEEQKENIKPSVKVVNEACTPKLSTASTKGAKLTDSKRHQTAKKIASLVRNPSALKPHSRLRSSEAKNAKPVAGIKLDVNAKAAGTPNLNQENQAIKRQKLEAGKSRQILSVRPPVLPHKTKSGLVNSSSNLCNPIATKANKEARKVYVRNQPQPTLFISTAEMIKKFESSTRDLSLPHVNSSLSHDTPASIIQPRPRLTLTRPKEPEFETAQRFRSVKVKSTAEMEEEMMAKIPKFKARPVNKKILEAPTLVIQRSVPKPPEFQEFHLETMARANQNAESASVTSTEISHQTVQWKPHLTEPKSPLLQTSLRARPPRVKTSIELEQEELEKLPKFKARPLNKKIFESKGNLGVFCNTKKHATIPQEFHFATDERFPPPAAVIDLFDKLSLTSEPQSENPITRNTAPSPFHLLTEERGTEKERKFMNELMQKQIEEERARIPKANPYPYTTDYPVVPPKPEPKHCTRPEPFQLESLVRHEEELQREMEERKRKENEEAQLRIFKAQPILKEDPIPVPEKPRIPLTEVQGFNLHVDTRAVERAEFDQKIKEKEMLYKRYREESEAARMIEEERALKQLRKTMVPHARPLPKFDHPFCPQKSSKERTKPKSPNLRVLRRKDRRNLVAAPCPAISAAAAHMR